MKYIGMPMGMWLLFAGSFRKQLSAVYGYDPETAKAIRGKAKPKYQEIIHRLPEFEKADRFKMNIVNSLTALHEKRGDSVKILFDCSYRDDTLQQYQAYIRTGTMTKDKENGDLFQKDLAKMVKGLQENIPGIGIYIWNHAEDAETHNTQHTIISSNVFDKLEDGVSVVDWICAAVNGDVQSHGLALLER